jgi:ketosteroid isomerase-like protein
MTTKDLDAFFEAGWNAHDVDLLMTFMSDDCVFESIAGPEACGTRHREARGRARGVLEGVRGVSGRPLRRGASLRLRRSGAVGVGLHGHQRRRRKVEVNGCDVFTFRGGKIALKSSFFKNRTAWHRDDPVTAVRFAVAVASGVC